MDLSLSFICLIIPLIFSVLYLFDVFEDSTLLIIFWIIFGGAYLIDTYRFYDEKKTFAANFIYDH